MTRWIYLPTPTARRLSEGAPVVAALKQTLG
jgi:hypothetical protein